MHVAAFVHLRLAHDWNVIFRLAGDDAGVAADAGGQINGHAPAVAVVIVFVRIVKRVGAVWVFRVRLLDSLGDEIGVSAELFQCASEQNIPVLQAVLALNYVVFLGGDQKIVIAGFGDFKAGTEPHGVGDLELIGIEAHAGANPADACAAIADMERDGIFSLARQYPDRRAQGASAEAQLNNIAVGEVIPLRQCGAD